MNSDEIFEQSRLDAIEDCDELLWLFGLTKVRLEQYAKILAQEKDFVVPQTHHDHNVLIESFMSRIAQITNLLEGTKKDLEVPSPTELLLQRASQIKQECGLYLRSITGIAGSLMVSLDWQSPSYDASMEPQAGSQRGKIQATFNDYKRDHHLDEQPYQEAFCREYIDATLKPFVKVFATSSGMAAFTTVLNFLCMEGRAIGPIVVGKSVYFQNKELLKKTFPETLIEVDEFDTRGICTLIQEKKPRVVFFDTLANCETLAMPHLDAIMEVLSKTSHDTYLVLDTTCTSVLSQPLKKYFLKPHKLHLFCIESLNKFHQFGLDRVSGGIIWGYGKDSEKLFTYRMHLGTNIPDASVHALPMPHRGMLEKRILRAGRNANILARHLAGVLERGGASVLEQIVYPGLASYPGYAWTKDLSFYGAFFVPVFRARYRSPGVYKKFIRQVIRHAKKENISIIAGTSFGFSLTRIYLTALQTTLTPPFLRISAGTETRREVDRIAGVLEDVLQTL